MEEYIADRIYLVLVPLSVCPVEILRGQLSSSSLASLPKSLTGLFVSVATTEQYMDIRPFLSELDSRLPCLKKFCE